MWLVYPGLSVYLANCRSLLPKMDDLYLLVSGQSPPSILALTETWLDSSIREYEVHVYSCLLTGFFGRIALNTVDVLLHLSFHVSHVELGD